MIKIKNRIKISSAMLLLASSFLSQATVVRISTSFGPIDVNLFDETTPKTVENFLSYVNSGAYENTIVHRSVPGFVIQAGGFTYTGPTQVVEGVITLDVVETDAPVENEPELSNVRGTIAMAKTSDPDSATSQWFINLDNNSQSLDVATNSGGFTVFGQVIGDGMEVVDDISALGFFGDSSVPVLQEIITEVTDEHLVVIDSIEVIDPAVVTNPDLNPTPNTLINPPTSGGDSDSGDSGGGGGALGWLMLLAGFGLTRYFRTAEKS